MQFSLIPSIELTFVNISLLVIAGIVSGFINVMAGSGSFITLPLMIFIGIPAPLANGTNRIAIFLQNIVSTRSFYKSKMLSFSTAIKLAIPTILGSIAGAQIAVDIDERIMEIVIGIVMLVMLAIMFYKPEKWLKSHKQQTETTHVVKLWYYPLFFVIGLYGGFIQAGVGIFLLTALVMVADIDVIRSNAIKVFINMVFTPFALLVFMLNNQVDYTTGLILSAGSITGAWIATKTAIKWGATYVRWIVIGVLIFSSVKLLFF